MIRETYDSPVDGSRWTIVVLPCHGKFRYSIHPGSGDPVTPDIQNNPTPAAAIEAAKAKIDCYAGMGLSEFSEYRR